jgi:tRNA (guanine37-N1)-methyltransferase
MGLGILTEMLTQQVMRFCVVTLFPEMFEAVASYGITGRAVSRGLVELHCINPRDFTDDRHQTVDGRPYGGGPGMVMMAGPLSYATAAAKNWLISRKADAGSIRVIYMSPQGKPLSHSGVMQLKTLENLVLIAGRYEGVDERFIEAEVDEEWSIGDYVLSGGELPAMVMIDALTRMLPGALGDAESATQDSFVSGLLDCPHYTRPEEYANRRVPSVLLSGDHKRIERWRLQQSLGRTAERRPELLQSIQLDSVSNELLQAYRAERETEQ